MVYGLDVVFVDDRADPIQYVGVSSGHCMSCARGCLMRARWAVRIARYRALREHPQDDMRRFISFDCGNKTLAWSHVTVNTNILPELEGAVKGIARAAAGLRTVVDGDPGALERDMREGHERVMAAIGAARALVREFVTYHDYGVADVLEGRLVENVGEAERAVALARFLRRRLAHCETAQGNSGPMMALIEHQPALMGFGAARHTNVPSSAVSHQLAFYYADYEPQFVSPRLKGRIALGPGLDYDSFLQAELARCGGSGKAGSDVKYTAGKKHSVANLKALLALIGRSEIASSVPAGILHNLADSTLQVLGWLQAQGAFARPSARPKRAKR